MNAGDTASALADEAAAWLIALSESPDDAALRAGLDAWRARSRRHEDAWNDTLRAYDLFGRVDPLHADAWRRYGRDGGRRLGGIVAKPASARPRRTAGRRAVMGMALALSACIAVLVLPGVTTRLSADHVTGTGEVRKVALEDGSAAWLAPGTALRLDMGKDGRGVALLSGQAFFEVVPDPARPFRVAAAGTTTTVLGTAFDVRIVDEGVAVSVRHGHVRVGRDGAGPVQDLVAGQSARLAPGALPARETVDSGDVAAWVTGELVARNLPVGDVVEALRPYHPGFIVVRDAGLSALTVTGIYDLRHPDHVLEAVAETHGLHVRKLSRWLTILERG